MCQQKHDGHFNQNHENNLVTKINPKKIKLKTPKATRKTSQPSLVTIDQQVETQQDATSLSTLFLPPTQTEPDTVDTEIFINFEHPVPKVAIKCN